MALGKNSWLSRTEILKACVSVRFPKAKRVLFLFLANLFISRV